MANSDTQPSSRSLWIPLFFVVVALLPVMILRDFSPANELRYISIADESISNGRFFAFYNHGIPYADKPPLYLWIVMAGRTLFGGNCMWFITLFSLIPALVTVLVMDRWSRSEISPLFRIDAMLLNLTCALFMGLSVFLRMDMLMTMWIVLALYSFFKIYRSEKRQAPLLHRVLFPVYIFLGIFTKGPMAILIPLVTTTVFLWENKQLREWGRYWGWITWGILLVLCGIWFSAVWAEGGKEYLDNLLFHQTLDRAVNAFHHKRRFWYYLTSIWYTFLPWTFLMIGAVVAGFLRKTRVRNDIDRFYLTAAVSTLVLLSCISSKIQVYLLPAYPFFCYLASIYMSRYPESKWVKAAIAVPVAIIAVAGALFCAIAQQDDFAFLNRPLLLAAGAILTVSAALSLWYLFKKRHTNLSIRWMAGGLLAAVFLIGLDMPELNSRAGYGILAGEAEASSRETGIDEIYAYSLTRAENLDAYLGSRSFTVVEREDTVGVDTVSRGVLMVGADGIDRFHGATKKQVGADWIVILDKTK